MKPLRFKYIVVGLSVLLIMSFLYIKTQSVDIDKHNHIIDRISQFKQVDAILNRHILEIRLGLLPYYDPTVNNIFQLQQLQTELTGMMQQLHDETSTSITRHAKSVQQALRQKQKALEAFKSSNAVINNSLHYLPVATTHVISRLPYNQQNDALRQTINTLLRDIMIFNLTSDNELGDKLNRDVNQLSKNIKLVPAEARGSLSILLSHIKIVLDHKRQLDRLMQQLLTVSTTQRVDRLLQAYLTEYNKMIQYADVYRALLYGLSVLLLAYIAYILWRLSKTASTLRRTITDLNYQKFAMDQHAIVSITDKHGDITYANQKFCDISNLRMDELIGRNHRIMKSGYHTTAFYKDMWQTISRGEVWRGQFQNRAKNDGMYCLDTTIVPFMDDNGEAYQYVAIRTDITKIKKAEETMRIQTTALQVAANGIVITDKNGVIQWVNDAFTRLTGYEHDEVIGKTPSILKSGKHEAAFYQDIWQTITSKRIWHGELINRRKNGNFYNEEQTISPVYDERGEVTHFIAIKQDITERQQTEEALRRSQKMEAIDQLSGGIAHDFNNQLGIILGYLDFLKTLYPDEGKPRQWVETATKATLRCTDLTRQLLAFSRRQSVEKKVIDLNASLQELETMIARSLTPEVEIQYCLADDLWLTEINAGEFHDVILNLSINARDAMPNGGELLIETSNIYLDADYAELNVDAKAGDYVQLMLSDTGSGMDRETLEHVFEPFFTTKPKDKGTGLGMAMVYGFVKRYHGHIKIYSKPGAGTTVRLYLPRSNTSEPATFSNIEDQEKLPTGSETILIVDDEIDLLQLARHYLSDLGYQTHIAENASQALKILAEDDRIDLLFSDVVMPGGTNGYELAQQATAQNPELKVLLTSGFTSKTIDRDILARFSDHLLSKPYRKAEMAQRIRLVLDERHT